MIKIFLHNLRKLFLPWCVQVLLGYEAISSFLEVFGSLASALTKSSIRIPCAFGLLKWQFFQNAHYLLQSLRDRAIFFVYSSQHTQRLTIISLYFFFSSFSHLLCSLFKTLLGGCLKSVSFKCTDCSSRSQVWPHPHSGSQPSVCSSGSRESEKFWPSRASGTNNAQTCMQA